MKHKTIWTLVIWFLIICIIELPIVSEWFNDLLMDCIIQGRGTNFLLFVIDIYIYVSVIALAMAKFAIWGINNLFFTSSDIKSNKCIEGETVKK